MNKNEMIEILDTLGITHEISNKDMLLSFSEKTWIYIDEHTISMKGIDYGTIFSYLHSDFLIKYAESYYSNTNSTFEITMVNPKKQINNKSFSVIKLHINKIENKSKIHDQYNYQSIFTAKIYGIIVSRIKSMENRTNLFSSKI